MSNYSSMQTGNIVIQKKSPLTADKVIDVFKTFIVYAILIFTSTMILLPLLWIIGASLNTSTSLMSSTPFPNNPTLIHYVELFTKTKFVIWFLNTLKIAVANMILSVILTITTAYVFTRFNFKGKKTGLLSILILQMFPSFMGMIAVYIILWNFKLYDNHWGLILVYAAGQIPFNTWLVRGYLQAISKSLDEAAKIDGASNIKIFTSIIAPLSKPIMIFVALTQFIAPWMDFIFPRLLLSSEKNKTLAIGLFDLIAGDTNKNFTTFTAGAVLVAVPITLLYVFLQKYLIEGITAGSNKG